MKSSATDEEFCIDCVNPSKNSYTDGDSSTDGKKLQRLRDPLKMESPLQMESVLKDGECIKRWTAP